MKGAGEAGRRPASNGWEPCAQARRLYKFRKSDSANLCIRRNASLTGALSMGAKHCQNAGARVTKTEQYS